MSRSKKPTEADASLTPSEAPESAPTVLEDVPLFSETVPVDDRLAGIGDLASVAPLSIQDNVAEPIRATVEFRLADAPPPKPLPGRRANGDALAPSLGHILHFKAIADQVLPALVVGVHYETDGIRVKSLDLVAFSATTIDHINGATFAGETPTSGAAYWPPRE